ncbi:Vacuolar protein sorting-associated protein 29 [Dispira parvispora]|uniref:Vacuolar protein sorting-associated protein 29 n=1 Tax=Dispira parvispora TaxID=1520584 RepID=A0A9W8E6T0_9FUNG|nr:Vacuolar protein sorting-associated protein 29 [Dispira parvispora]
MVLVLVIGDLHIPQRAVNIPDLLRSLLVPGKIQQILCTGNLTDRETYTFLRNIAEEIHVVKGDMDEPGIQWPESKVVQHGNIRIGLIHGHQIIPNGDTEALATKARQLDVDILITGHTNRFEAFDFDGKFFVSPGSATGAYNIPDGRRKVVPSFALLDIQDSYVITYVYQLDRGRVKVDKLEFKKE